MSGEYGGCIKTPIESEIFEFVQRNFVEETCVEQVCSDLV